MNKNPIRPTSTNLDVQSFIRRCDIAYDERARFVEFVCSIWNEGRFGPNLADPVTVDQPDRPEPSFAELYDPRDAQSRNTTVRECARPQRNSSQGRASSHNVAQGKLLWDVSDRVSTTCGSGWFESLARSAFRTDEPLNSASALTPNQGRGSP